MTQRTTDGDCPYCRIATGDDDPPLRVERDEAPVDLLVDGRRIGPVPPEAPVRIERGGSISMVAPPEP